MNKNNLNSNSFSMFLYSEYNNKKQFLKLKKKTLYTYKSIYIKIIL